VEVEKLESCRKAGYTAIEAAADREKREERKGVSFVCLIYLYY